MHEDCHAPQNDLLFQERVQYSLADIKFWHKTFCTEKLMLNFQCSAPAHCWCNSLRWAQHGFAKTKKRAKKRIIGHCWFCKFWEETYLWKHYKIHTESIIFHNFLCFNQPITEDINLQFSRKIPNFIGGYYFIKKALQRLWRFHTFVTHLCNFWRLTLPLNLTVLFVEGKYDDQ